MNGSEYLNKNSKNDKNDKNVDSQRIKKCKKESSPDVRVQEGLGNLKM